MLILGKADEKAAVRSKLPDAHPWRLDIERSMAWIDIRVKFSGVVCAGVNQIYFADGFWGLISLSRRRFNNIETKFYDKHILNS